MRASRKVDVKSLQALSAAIRAPARPIEELSLSGNALGDDAVKLVASWLPDLRQLRGATVVVFWWCLLVARTSLSCPASVA